MNWAEWLYSSLLVIYLEKKASKQIHVLLLKGEATKARWILVLLIIISYLSEYSLLVCRKRLYI